VIESGEQELFDARGPIGLAQRGQVCRIGAKRFGHPRRLPVDYQAKCFIGQRFTGVALGLGLWTLGFAYRLPATI
jgi:hypothetical protein